MSGESSIVGKKRIIGSMLWKVAERLTSQVLGLIIQIVLARILMPEDFGDLAIINAIICYCAIFVHSGLSIAIVQKEKLEKVDVSTLLIVSMTVATLLYIGIFVTAPYIAVFYSSPSLVWPLRVEALVLFLGGINSVQAALFQRDMRFKSLFWRSFLSVPISGIIGVVMALKGFGIWALVAQSISHNLVMVIYMSFDPCVKVGRDFDMKRAISMFRFSGKILLSNLVCGSMDVVRTMTIGKKYTPEQLAFYDKAYSYSNLVTNVVTTSMSSVLLPTFSRQQDDSNKVLAMSRASVRATAFIMCPLLCGVIAVAEPLVLGLLSEKWAACIPFLCIFCLLRLPGCISIIDKQMYYAYGNSSIAMWYEIGLLVANISVLVLTVSHGIMAVAIGATIVEWLGNLVLFCISAWKYGYRLSWRLADVWKSALCSIIMIVVVKSLGNICSSIICSLLIQIVVGCVVYVASSFIIGNKMLSYFIDIIKNTGK